MNITKFQISETFSSIQGEGLLTGYNTFFVRLQGCRIGCKWCDTKSSWKKSNKKISAPKVLAKILEGAKEDTHVCITGGEPLLQLSSLLWLTEKLANKNYGNISIESCGIVEWNKQKQVLPDKKDILDIAGNDVFFSISPKLKSAVGEKSNIKEIVDYWSSLSIAEYKLQFKFVVSDVNDIKQIEELLNNYHSEYVIILQIEDSKIRAKKFIEKVIDLTKQFPFIRLMTQQHKALRLK